MISNNIMKSGKAISLLRLRNATSTLFRNQSSSSNLVQLEVNDKSGIANLTMNSPPVNSLNLELLTAFSDSLDVLTKNGSKGMILTSVRISRFLCLTQTGFNVDAF